MYSIGKAEDQDGPAVLDKGDPNYDSEGEEGEKPTEKPAAKENKPVVYEGAAAGKYNWDDNKKSVDVAMGEAITKYSWADGKKRVSIYIEMEGLDDLADDAFTTASGEKDVSLTIANVGGKRRRFALTGLFAEIDGVKLERKKGKNTVVLKLQKKEEKPWYKLQEGSGKAADDDEDPGAGGMMGGMDMGGGMMGGGMMGGGG